MIRFRPIAPRLCVLLLPLATGGCISTAATVVKAPFAVGGKVVDWTITSQAEADRNYGRKMRKAEAREGRERREWAKRCHDTPDTARCRQYDGFRASG